MEDDRIDFLVDVYSQVKGALDALDHLKESKGAIFSEIYPILKRWNDRDSSWDYVEINAEIGPDTDLGEMVDSLDCEGFLETYLEPDFQFSEDPEKFMHQLKGIMFLVTHDKQRPGIELAIMKAVFNAGKLFSRLEWTGRQRSDIPREAGATTWKNKVSYQDIIETYYKIDTKEKSNNAICEAVREELIKRKELKKGGNLTEDEKKKFIYSTKWIGNILSEELEKVS